MQLLNTSQPAGFMPAIHDRFLGFIEVAHQTSLGRTYIYELIKAGQFPKPYKLGKRASRWKQSEVTAWISSRRAA